MAWGNLGMLTKGLPHESLETISGDGITAGTPHRYAQAGVVQCIGCSVEPQQPIAAPFSLGQNGPELTVFQEPLSL
jgi:hypothetical protein